MTLGKLVTAATVLAAGIAPLLVIAALLGGGGSAAAAPAAVSDIPPRLLVLYRAAAERYELGPEGWSVLAAIGKMECDHGRSPLDGCGRGEQNFAGARGPAQFLASTWRSYGVDGDGDADRDVWDPVDAVFGMANYLRASGAPGRWREAIYAYNHADWYVRRVLEQAARYGAASSGRIEVGGGRWLAPLPDFPGEQCDARIVGEVTALARTFGIRVADCFGGAPHSETGEHPLGLAIDAVPADGDWRRTELLARRFGWRESCARRGCVGGRFKVVLYNGFPGHGDPRHTTNPHLHLSWEHGATAPFSRAPWVRLVLAGAAG